MIGSLRGEISHPLVVHLRCQAEYVLCRRTASMQQNDGRGRLGQRRTQQCGQADHDGDRSPASPFYLRVCSAIGGSMRSTRERCRSSQGGSLRASPSDSIGSSRANPGGSVAISNKTPPGSRK